MELTYEQWKEATPKERTEYFKWLVSQTEIDENGDSKNLQYFATGSKKFIKQTNISLNHTNVFYRIKPAPKYRAFKNIAEFMPHIVMDYLEYLRFVELHEKKQYKKTLQSI